MQQGVQAHIDLRNLRFLNFSVETMNLLTSFELPSSLPPELGDVVNGISEIDVSGIFPRRSVQTTCLGRLACISNVKVLCNLPRLT